ncbi:efflux RND transporter permease subunit [Agarilytica rhodophyticola]|uniref:efflux RND transporter permease subunit n=1 Tax=Agarilytica rhodophyticola TaxID=1737490 RepID=UPI000B3494E8|nr:efflux RND transporter permease subunit [Agarilytica rhodophyticola]
MTQQRGLIAYFVYHPVAANLLLLLVSCMGLLSYNSIQRQTFPVSENNKIIIQATIFGESAKEIEESVLIKIEQALKPQAGVKRLTSLARPGEGQVTIELENGENISSRLDEIKLKLDSIASFPGQMEPLLVYEKKQTQRAISIVVSGPSDPMSLKKLGNEVKSELLQLDGISHVELSALPDYEVAIEIRPIKMQEYGLSLQKVVSAIQSHSDNISAGEIKTDRGNIYLRLEQRSYIGEKLADIPVIVGELGEKVLLKDLANIKDGFRETLSLGRLNGRQAVYIMVFAGKNQSLNEVVQQVQAYVKRKTETLPSEIEIYEFVDVTFYLDGRLNMMLENLAQGAVLVFIILAIFLRTRLAVWVMVGLPVSFLGAFWLMPWLGVTINLVSLFAFIMVLGIVVDDAIVIGESICDQTEQSGHSKENIITGTHKVATPATFGVLTTVAIFTPFMLSSGPNSGQFIAIAGVCILCLLFSLVESKLILPAHLGSTYFAPLPENHWRQRFNNNLQQFLKTRFQPLLTYCIHYRYAVICAFIILLALAISLVISGQVRFISVPKVPHDYPSINIKMNQNVSEAQTLAAAAKIENMMRQVEQEIMDETGQAMMESMYTRVDHLTEAEVVVPLVPEAERPFDTFELARRWRLALPEIPGVKKLTIESDVIDIFEDGDLSYRLFAKDVNLLQQASSHLINELSKVEGVYNLSSSIDSSQTEYKITLKPLAYQLQLTAKEVVQQVGAQFYGLEAQRVIREGQEILFMVRGPLSDRQQLSALTRTLITLPQGGHVFFGDIAEYNEVPGVSTIDRELGFQVVTVNADVDEAKAAVAGISNKVEQQIIPELLTQYPGVTTKLGGALFEQRKEQSQMATFALVGLFVIYLLLALPLKSYLQPLIVMSVIPFSLTGAIWAHFFLGYSLSMMSIFGIIAAAGVVINDSLVITDVINNSRLNGKQAKDVVVDAAKKRFRAILLTSLTTFFGLLPIMFEPSLQAQFVIPMAISLSFSVLFATLVSLIMVPCLYIVQEDLKLLFSRLLSAPITRYKLSK